MYACLFRAEAVPGELYELALALSPAVEQTDPSTVVFSIAPLRKLLGSPHQIASEISRAGYERKLQANLAIASNPDSAILLARYYPGVTLVTPGEEREKLGAIPLHALFALSGAADDALLDVLHRWGLKNCEDLAALPEQGVVERLGKAGHYLQQLACGAMQRPLRLAQTETNYEEHLELEHRLELLEPLLFLLGSALQDLCLRMRAQSRAARLLSVELKLEDREPYQCALEFPVPLADSRAMLKLLQLHLERHPPKGAITAFTLRVDPAEPRRTQNGLFLPPVPRPDKLQLTLARIAGMVGKENVGTPELLDTWRPDAFRLQPLPALTMDADPDEKTKPATLQLVMRLFRPALPARVRLMEYAPKAVLASCVKGKVLRSAGPWKTSGEWWAATFWCREEWDVALDDGALYRIYQDVQSGSWFVHGVYD
jgi:protein ImuB